MLGLHEVEQRQCPHEQAVLCPLYLACHRQEVSYLSCDDGELHTQVCAVNRGLNYAANEARIRWFHRAIWQEIEAHYHRLTYREILRIEHRGKPN